MVLREIFNNVQGIHLNLRLVQIDDADYIHALRINPEYNQHLSPVSGTVSDQRAWIRSYKSREAEGLEYYFIIERTDHIPCGVVRLYDIGQASFTWGSWILDHNKPRKAALESAVLSFAVGFEELNMPRALLEVRRDNSHATSFYRRFGATEIGNDTMNIYFELTREKFLQDRESYRQIIENAE